MLKVLLPSLLLVACASSDAPDEQRGLQTDAEGKADSVALTGSCAAGDFCGGKSAGNCHCDDQCKDFHDCCADAAPVCGVESNRLDDRTAGLQPLKTAEVFA